MIAATVGIVLGEMTEKAEELRGANVAETLVSDREMILSLRQVLLAASTPCTMVHVQYITVWACAAVTCIFPSWQTGKSHKATYQPGFL